MEMSKTSEQSLKVRRGMFKRKCVGQLFQTEKRGCLEHAGGGNRYNCGITYNICEWNMGLDLALSELLVSQAVFSVLGKARSLVAVNRCCSINVMFYQWFYFLGVM